MICPLVMVSGVNKGECFQENCAWWCRIGTGSKGCAMKLIGEAAKGVADDTSQAISFIERITESVEHMS